MPHPIEDERQRDFPNINVRLHPDLYRRFTDLCRKEGRSRANLAARVIDAYMREQANAAAA